MKGVRKRQKLSKMGIDSFMLCVLPLGLEASTASVSSLCKVATCSEWSWVVTSKHAFQICRTSVEDIMSHFLQMRKGRCLKAVPRAPSQYCLLFALHYPANFKPKQTIRNQDAMLKLWPLIQDHEGKSACTQDSQPASLPKFTDACIFSTV